MIGTYQVNIGRAASSFLFLPVLFLNVCYLQPLAKFVDLAKAIAPSLIFFTVSFVGPEAYAGEVNIHECTQECKNSSLLILSYFVVALTWS